MFTGFVRFVSFPGKIASNRLKVGVVPSGHISDQKNGIGLNAPHPPPCWPRTIPVFSFFVGPLIPLHAQGVLVLLTFNPGHPWWCKWKISILDDCPLSPRPVARPNVSRLRRVEWPTHLHFRFRISVVIGFWWRCSSTLEVQLWGHQARILFASIHKHL